MHHKYIYFVNIHRGFCMVYYRHTKEHKPRSRNSRQPAKDSRKSRNEERKESRTIMVIEEPGQIWQDGTCRWIPKSLFHSKMISWMPKAKLERRILKWIRGTIGPVFLRSMDRKKPQIEREWFKKNLQSQQKTKRRPPKRFWIFGTRFK